ncbi:MAG: YdgA family protein [Candidimonas sp.]|nr:YdgA family protein [Candidimonas sp.]
MRKSTGLVGVVAIVAIAWVGATWYVGTRAQQTIEDVVAQANERLTEVSVPASGTSLEIVSYDRGWFSSQVVYTLHMKDADGAARALTMQDHLHHGPFPWSAVQSGKFAPMLAHSKAHVVATPATQAWVDSQQGGSPLTIETQVGFGGSGHSTWTFAPVDMMDEGDALRFSGGQLLVDFTDDFKSNQATGQFASLLLTNEEMAEKLELKDLQVKSSTQSSNNDTVTVQSQATVSAFTLDEGDDSPVVINDMAIHFDSVQTGKLLDGTLRYDFGQVAVGEFALGSVSIGGKVLQLDMEALRLLAMEYDAIQASLGDNDDESAVVLSNEQEARLQERLQAVLASSPVFSIEPFVWKNDQGETRGSLQASLAKPAADGKQSLDLMLAQMLRQLKLDLTISRPMLIQAFGQAQGSADERARMEMMGAMVYDQYMGRLEQAGLVQQRDGTGILGLHYEDQVVTVNGQAMPVAEFMQRALSVVM